MSWGYGKDNGPATWAKFFKDAAGDKQSPIDIKTGSVTFDPSLAKNPLVINLQSEKGLEIANIGFSVKANIKENSTLQGGPLKNEYKLDQFHFHWGSTNEKGADHTIDGKTFPIELHVVYWNKDKYQSFKEAADKDDGLAILSVLFKVGKENSGLKPFTDVLNKIKFKGNAVHLDHDFNPSCLLPRNTANYWTYHGSLTWPPCYESTTWFVFPEILDISEDQLKAFRGLFSTEQEGENIVDNFRPTLPLGSRKVSSSFK